MRNIFVVLRVAGIMVDLRAHHDHLIHDGDIVEVGSTCRRMKRAEYVASSLWTSAKAAYLCSSSGLHTSILLHCFEVKTETHLHCPQGRASPVPGLAQGRETHSAGPSAPVCPVECVCYTGGELLSACMVNCKHSLRQSTGPHLRVLGRVQLSTGCLNFLQDADIKALGMQLQLGHPFNQCIRSRAEGHQVRHI